MYNQPTIVYKNNKRSDMHALLFAIGLVCVSMYSAQADTLSTAQEGMPTQAKSNTAESKHNPFTSEPKVHALKQAKPDTKNTFYFGRVYHEVSEPYNEHHSSHSYTQYHNYRGLRAAFQHEHAEHIATLYALETAKLDSITIEDKDRNDTIYNLILPESVRYLGVKSSVIASTNLNKGWQFYLGGGVFYDTYLKDSGNTNNYGVRYDFGTGYSWYHCQAMLRFSGDLTNSQSNSNAESAEAVIEIGYNF